MSLGPQWLRTWWPRPAATVRVVIFPHGGGSASFYRPLAKALPDWMEPVVVQYPGREDRLDETPIDDMALLSDLLTESVARSFDRPVVLAGHSMGASVAHEVTRALAARHRLRPALLVVSGRAGPRCQKPGDKHLDDDKLWAEISGLGGTDPRLLQDPAIRRMVLPALRADYRLVETYRAARPSDLTCPLAACVGDADDEVTVEESEAWREATTGPCTTRTFPGGHFYLRPEPGALAGWLADVIHHTLQQEVHRDRAS